MRYAIENTHNGYVVYGIERGEGCFPLRNFGDLQSAAINFRDFCARHIDTEKAMRYAKTFDPRAKYTYPEIKGERCNLRKQQRHGQEETQL